MTPTEQRYSQIEKEALATTWSLERFNDYLYAMSFHVETDHKPLVSLLSSKKNLDELSPRIQRFRMRLMRYMYTIAHVPGKSLVTADALSLAPQERPLTEAEELLTDEVTAQANLVVGALPATEKRLAEIRARQLEDDVCRQVMRYCAEGWPSHPSLPSVLRPYWQVQNELTIQNGLLLKGVRLIIPTCMRLAMLDKLHEGHQGVVRCRSRAQVFRMVARTQSATGGVGAQLHSMRRRTTQSIRADDRIWDCPETMAKGWHGHVRVQEGDLFASGWLRQQLRRDSQVGSDDIARRDSAPEIHLRETWDPRDCCLRQRATVCVTWVCAVCQWGRLHTRH